jgi:hypothetical protein
MCPDLQCVTVIWQEREAQLQRLTYADIDFGNGDGDRDRGEVKHILQRPKPMLAESIITTVDKYLYVVPRDHEVMLKRWKSWIKLTFPAQIAIGRQWRKHFDSNNRIIADATRHLDPTTRSNEHVRKRYIMRRELHAKSG